uniref:B30.2/SPRY domain-containing protein n=1 Tax=Astyanax mexicanus TaxID=7994 RepID=W5L8Q9_ASTMX
MFISLYLFTIRQQSTKTEVQPPTVVDGISGFQQELNQPEEDVLHRVFERHKQQMKKKCESVFEVVQTQSNKTLLNRIYTQLYIIEGESEGVNEEHEVLQMEKRPGKQRLQDTAINCNDVFKSSLNAGLEDGMKECKEIRKVMTKGIAGIGKTVSVQKFVLDWAEGEANLNVDIMFVLPFRELNLIKDGRYNLHTLLCNFHPELKDLDAKIYSMSKAVFIFDGLDESRIPMNFSQCEKVSDPTTVSSVGVLMTNLIKGELLPSALIWITSRPAAANQIPPQLIDRMTEIQGFNDPQKEEYFQKRISDHDQAIKIISHIKQAKSLYIMCHIPVFCWISATVLQKILEDTDAKDIPTTLTEMYIHFLLIQTSMKNQKYGDYKTQDLKEQLKPNRIMILKLSELAFKQLTKGNVMFYEEDLNECGIDVTEASVYSGICTQIFKEESVLYSRKVYCFVHLSFQEFLAAFYVFYCFSIQNMETLRFFKPPYQDWCDNVTLEELLEGAVRKALRSQNGGLDLFLRFLLGISLESNQRLLQGLLTHTQTSSNSINQIITYIHKQIKGEDELELERISEYLSSEKHSEKKLSPGQCAALACMLRMSEEVLEEFDLKKYNTTEEGYRRLIPAVSNCRKALLAGCNLTTKSCEILTSALQSENSSLKVLDLSDNILQDEGLEKLSAGLKSSNCKIEILRLAGCTLSISSCEILCSSLKSANTPLKELDLSNNELLDSGVEMLSAGLKSSQCELETLRLSGCLITEKGCSSLSSALHSNPSYLKELDLTYNQPGDSGVKLLSSLLEDPQCKIEILRYAYVYFALDILHVYACELTLDPNTVQQDLALSEGNKKVMSVREQQEYPDHPDRFDVWLQVLCKEPMCGRCYWEAESGGRGFAVAVTYKGISRKGGGDDCRFGYNEKSWRLYCTNSAGTNSYSVWHKKKIIDIPAPAFSSSRVGMFLDWAAGILSFYLISPDTNTLTHMHTYYSKFSEPLYAGFWIGFDSSVRIG